MTIQVNFQILVKHGEGNTNSPELPLLKIFPLAYHHSHFLAATWDFSQWAFWDRTLFLQLRCFGLDFTSFCNCTLFITSILLSLNIICVFILSVGTKFHT